METKATRIWEEPPIGSYPDPALIGLSGFERMRAFLEGRVPFPPIFYLTEIPFTNVSRGHAGFKMPASPWFANATGIIPGGMAAVLADAPLGTALDTDLPPGVAYTTAEMSLTFLRPVRPDPKATVSASGQLLHRTHTVGVTEAFLIDDTTDQLVAFASSRLAIFPPIDPIPDPPDELPVIEQPIPGSTPEHPLRRPVQGEVLPQAEFDRLSGREMLEGWISGELPNPPLAELIGFRVTGTGDGEAEMTMPSSAWLSTALRTVQGGFIAMLAEVTLASAAFSTVEPGTALAPLDLKVNFLRPVQPDGRELTGRAEVIHRGRTLAISSCRVENADGKPVALATGSSMYLPGRPANLIGVELGSSSSDPEDDPGAGSPD
jgi:uncharacterized protein (TIGR00369 family)